MRGHVAFRLTGGRVRTTYLFVSTRLTKTEQTILDACDGEPKTGAELRTLTAGRSRLFTAKLERMGLLRSGVRRDGAAVWSKTEET